MDILQRITDLRNERDLSINKLAKLAGLAQSTISNLYNRDYEPTMSTIESICNGFGISLAEFFNVDNESTILTDDQKRLLLDWSKLTESQKQLIFGLFKELK